MHLRKKLNDSATQLHLILKYQPAGPTMLWWLPPKSPATSMVQIAVMNPDSGVESAAIPRDMDSGM